MRLSVQVRYAVVLCTLCAVAVFSACRSTAVPKAEQRAYDRAVAAYDAERYRVAATRFTDFLMNYPDSRLTPIAWFYLADSYRALRLYQNASDAYDHCLAAEPYAPLVPNVLYHKGRVMEKLGQKEQAAIVYEQLVREYAEAGAHYGDWVDLARERLKDLGVPN